MIKVQKHNEHGRLVWEYIGKTLERTERMICLEAFFGRDKVDIGMLTFEKGDRMVEWFYADQYFNIFQVEAGESRKIKGWYCNVARPATITDEIVVAEDLALDVVVTPDGTIYLLDEDDFDALTIYADERQKALDGVATLRAWVAAKQGPFKALTDAT
jgi:uncharacterized protein